MTATRVDHDIRATTTITPSDKTTFSVSTLLTLKTILILLQSSVHVLPLPWNHIQSQEQNCDKAAFLCFVQWCPAKWPREVWTRTPTQFLNSCIRFTYAHSSLLLVKPRMTSSINQLGSPKWFQVEWRVRSVALTWFYRGWTTRRLFKSTRVTDEGG